MAFKGTWSKPGEILYIDPKTAVGRILADNPKALAAAESRNVHLGGPVAKVSMAYDSAMPRPKINFDAIDDDVTKQLLGFLGDKLSPPDLARFKEMLAANSGGGTDPDDKADSDNIASDSAYKAGMTTMYRDGKLSTRDYETAIRKGRPQHGSTEDYYARFPDASKIRSI